MAEWTVVHTDENGDTDTIKPVNLEFELVHKDAGSASYDVPLAWPTMRGGGEQGGFVGPKRTTYEVYRSGRLITAGIHSLVNTKRGEEVLHVQGKTWLWYLQNRHWPFDGTDPNFYVGGDALLDQGIAYQDFIDPTDHIATILFTIFTVVPHGNPFNLTHSFIPVAHDVPFRIELADTRSVYDMMLELSEAEIAGFDFYDVPQREIIIIPGELFPESARTNPGDNIWIFDRHVPPNPIIEIEFENSGPEMTHIMGIGSGTSSQLVRTYGDEQTQSRFGRWDGVVQFSEVMQKTQLQRRTKIHFSKAAYPQRHLNITVNAEAIPNFWQDFKPGWSVWVRENFESNTADNAYVIRHMTAHISNQGDEIVELDLEEINLSGQFGTPQG